LPDLTETCAADVEFWYANRQTWRRTQEQIHRRSLRMSQWKTNERKRGQEGEEVTHGNGKLWR